MKITITLTPVEVEMIYDALDYTYEGKMEDMGVGFEERPHFAYAEDRAEWTQARKFGALALRIRRHHLGW